MSDVKLYQKPPLAPGAGDLIYASRADGSEDGKLDFNAVASIMRSINSGYYDAAGAANTAVGAFAASLATVATSGAYSDLSGAPSLSAVATSGDYNDLANLPSLATVATTGAYADLSGTPTLAAVATTGAYADLSGKPTLGALAALDTITASYVTDFSEATDDRVAALLSAGTGISLSYDDAGNLLTITNTAPSAGSYTDENARDAIGAALTAGSGISITVNDPSDTITLASTITQYTDEMARDAIGAALVAGTNVTVTVNDPGDTITIDGISTEAVQDIVGGLLASGNGITVTYNDAGNVESIAITEASDSETWTGSAVDRVVTPRRLFSSAVTQTLTDGATITIDGNTGLNFKVTLGGNRTLANPTNMKTGQSGVIIVTQDATGSRTLTYGSNWKFPGGAASGGVLSTGANKVDLMSYYVRSDGTILATLTKDFS